jgi:hypothetical protein
MLIESPSRAKLGTNDKKNNVMYGNFIIQFCSVMESVIQESGEELDFLSLQHRE